MKYLYHLILLLLLNVHTSGFSQSTQDLFSIPGLAFVIDQYDDTGFFTDVSLYYMGDTLHQDTLYHHYENKSRAPFYLYIEKYKVYVKSLGGQYKSLRFDFGLEVGDTIVKYGNNYILESKGVTQLEDGLDRIEMNFVGSEYPNHKTTLIEGIGYERQGFFVNSSGFDYNVLQCVSSDKGQIILKEGFSFDECNSRSCPGIETSFVIDGEKENINLTYIVNNHDSISLTFGDGVYFDELVNSYTYLEKGCYEIELEAFNECGESSYYQKFHNYCGDPKWYKKAELKIKNLYFLDENLGYGISNDDPYKTIDGGNNWEKMSLPEAEEPYSVVSIYFSDSQNGVMATSAKTDNFAVLMTSDGGNTWTGILSGDFNLGNALMTKEGDIFASSKSSIYRTLDNGQNWTKLIDIPYGFFHGDFQLTRSGDLTFARIYYQVFDHPNVLYISSNNGDSWKKIDLTFDRHLRSVYFHDANHGYVSMEGDVYKTLDGGDTWDNVQSFKEGGLANNIQFMNEMEGLMVFYNRYYMTFDGGQSWNFEYCSNTESIFDVFAIDGQYYSGNRDGFYKRMPNPDYDCGIVNSVKTKNELNVEIAPNPTTDYFHIIGNGEGNYQVEIRDLKGAVLLSTNIFSDESIDTADLSMGLYLVSIQKDNLRQTLKLVKH